MSRAAHVRAKRLWSKRLARRKAALLKLAATDPGYKRAAYRVRVARKRLADEKAWLAAHPPLRLRALAEAEKLVGIMEQGGNNQGEAVMRIIRANGGTGPEPWCGDTMAYAYRAAGSKSVTRLWASVRSFLGRMVGIKRIPLAEAKPGDLIIYKFDHVGMLRSKVNGSTWETIEGNTGASGAVSDSSTGGDGVYVKRRSTDLIAAVVRVTR